MKNIEFIKWLILACVMHVVAAYVMFYQNLLPYLLAVDHTYICLSILSILFLSTYYIGYLLYNPFKITSLSVDRLNFISSTLMGLGLLATIAGNMIIFAVFADPTLSSNIPKLLSEIGKGFSVVQIGTFIGILSYFLVKIQLVFFLNEAKD